MRNLKRALSLALASIMLLGMMVVGTSAASYPDVDEKDNVEAIEVLNAVQVMIGDRGNFRPDAKVNRHEMAVIMAKLVLGNEAADNYVGTHPFTDVFPWADKYVAACYENGLVSGTSATTFSGNQPLTAVQAAAMMLRALGYKDLSKGASDWRAPVTAMANQIRLFNGVASNPKEELDRNQVAQLALNTLKSPVVDLKDGTFDITSGDGQVVISGGSREYIVRSSLDSYAQAISAVEQRGNSASGVGGYTIELGEHLYNGKLRLEDAIDDFGRPARYWEYDGKVIGTYAKTELLRRTYTDKVTGKDVYDLLGANVIRNYSNDSDYAYVDGAVNDAINKGQMIRSNDDALPYTGRGVITEIYVDSANEEFTIVSINTYLAEVTADYNKNSETLPITIYNAIKPTAVPEADTIPCRLELEDFANLADFAKDDMVRVKTVVASHKPVSRVAKTDYTVDSIEDAEIVEDVTLTAYTMSDKNTLDNNYRLDTMTAAGGKYEASATAFYDASILYNYNDERQQLKDSTYDLYLDANGYVIGIEPVDVADNYVFVVGYEVGYSPIASSVDKALVIHTDGTAKTVNIRDDKAKVWDNTLSGGKGAWKDMTDFVATENNNKNARINTWFTYSVDSDGTYMLDKEVYYQGVSAESYAVNGVRPDLPTHNDRKNDTTTESTVRPVAYGNDNTVYIAVKADGTTVAATTPGTIVDVNSTTTGVKNVDITVKPFGAAMKAEKTSSAAQQAITNATAFFVYGTDGYIDYAVVIGEDKSGSDNTIFFASGATGRRYDSELDKYYVSYDVIRGGAQTTIEVEDGVASDANPVQGDLFVATVNKNGKITALVGGDHDGDTDDNNAALIDTLDANMNTNAYKTSGYAQQTAPNASSPIGLRADGSTLWVTNTTLSNGRFVILANDCQVFFKPYTDSKYTDMGTGAGAAANAVSALTTDSTVAYVSKVTAVCDKTTGYATTLIITETKVGSSIISSHNKYTVEVIGATPGSKNIQLMINVNDALGNPTATRLSLAELRALGIKDSDITIRQGGYTYTLATGDSESGSYYVGATKNTWTFKNSAVAFFNGDQYGPDNNELDAYGGAAIGFIKVHVSEVFAPTAGAAPDIEVSIRTSGASSYTSATWSE